MFKKILNIIIIFILLLSICNIVLADDITNSMSGLGGDLPSELRNMASVILGIIQFVGYGICVITITILGIKYMVGGASEKAEYKKTMAPIVIGMVILFLASTLIGIVAGFTNNTFNQ